MRNRKINTALRYGVAGHSASEVASSASEVARSVAEWACSGAGKPCSRVRHAFPAAEWIYSDPEQVRGAFRKPSPEPDLSRSASELASSATEQASPAAGQTTPSWPLAWARPPPASAALHVVNYRPWQVAEDKPST